MLGSGRALAGNSWAERWGEQSRCQALVNDQR